MRQTVVHTSSPSPASSSPCRHYCHRRRPCSIDGGASGRGGSGGDGGGDSGGGGTSGKGGGGDGGGGSGGGGLTDCPCALPLLHLFTLLREKD